MAHTIVRAVGATERARFHAPNRALELRRNFLISEVPILTR